MSIPARVNLQRAIMRYKIGWTLEEVAREEKVALETIRQRLIKARVKIRRPQEHLNFLRDLAKDIEGVDA